MNKLLFTETNYGNSIHDRERYPIYCARNTKKGQSFKTIQKGRTKSLKRPKEIQYNVRYKIFVLLKGIEIVPNFLMQK